MISDWYTLIFKQCTYYLILNAAKYRGELNVWFKSHGVENSIGDENINEV